MTTFDRTLSITLRILLVAVLTLALFFGLLWGLENQERSECRSWSVELQGNEHLQVSVAEWQADQCEELGVPLPASP